MKTKKLTSLESTKVQVSAVEATEGARKATGVAPHDWPSRFVRLLAAGSRGARIKAAP